MTVKRGEIWIANLNPIRGSEQEGVRPSPQLRVLDTTRLQRKLGTVSRSTLLTIEAVVPSCWTSFPKVSVLNAFEGPFIVYRQHHDDARLLHA